MKILVQKSFRPHKYAEPLAIKFSFPWIHCDECGHSYRPGGLHFFPGDLVVWLLDRHTEFSAQRLNNPPPLLALLSDEVKSRPL